MDPSSLVDRYFACMRGRDLDGLVALFAPDIAAVFPDGREVNGAEALQATYQHIFNAGGPVPTPQAQIVGPALAAIEVASRLPDGTTRLTANFIHIGPDQLITRLSIYKRGNW